MWIKELPMAQKRLFMHFTCLLLIFSCLVIFRQLTSPCQHYNIYNMAPSLEQVTIIVINLIIKLTRLQLRIQAIANHHAAINNRLGAIENETVQIHDRVEVVRQELDREVQPMGKEIDKRTRPKLCEIFCVAGIFLYFLGFIYFQLAANDDHEIFSKINEVAQKTNVLYQKAIEQNKQIRIHQQAIQQSHFRCQGQQPSELNHRNHPIVGHDESQKQASTTILSRKTAVHPSRNMQHNTPTLPQKAMTQPFNLPFENMTVKDPSPSGQSIHRIT